jgi:mannan endo-1,4-beta-mannosidase
MFLCFVAVANAGEFRPANPNTSLEAKALLGLLHEISGKYILTGQHNFPNAKNRNSQFASKYIGKTPAIFSTDFGFAKDGDKDSYLARQDIVAEAIKQHQMGFIVAIMWHAVPPTANEPVTFQPNRIESKPDSLNSVQGKLLDQQFDDLLTPGTEIYKHWCTQVDTIASYLRKLQQANVPVLWRPYHEMNGDWFWWGGRHEEKGTAALYRQLYDRFINYHKLNNLIWIWSVDRPSKPERQFSYYYPGKDYLDVVALDVYGKDFNQDYYDSLSVYATDKVLALAEVGNPPTVDVLDTQPNWALYVIWSGMVRNTLKKEYAALVNDSRVLSYNDSIYCKIMTPFRSVCGLSPLPVDKLKADFSGEWVFNEDKSSLDNQGVGNLPTKLNITQNEDDLVVQKTFVEEYTDDRITKDRLTLDGKENKTEMMNAPQIITANWSAKHDSLFISSKVTFKFGERTVEMNSNEK